MKRFTITSISLVVLCTLALVTLFFTPGCAKKRPEPKEIKIGVILPLSGNTALLGEQHKWGIVLALEDINSKGGINGKKLIAVYEDDKNEPLEAVNAFNKLIGSFNPPVIVSGMSSSSMAILPKAESEKIVLFANCGHPDIAKNSKWVFRNFLTGTQEAAVMATLCIKEFDVKELGILYINDSYGEGGKNAFELSYSQLGGRILQMEEYDKNGTDFRTEITKMLASNPKAIYVFGYGNATGIVLRQLKELGYKDIILGTNNFSGPPVTTVAGDSIEGAIFTAPYFSPEVGDQSIQEFVGRVKKRFGKEPYWNTAVEYDAMWILAKAMKIAARCDGQSLRDDLEEIGNFEGIAGIYEYNNREWQLKLTVRKYLNGKRVIYNKMGEGDK
jgi:branched-chain amino acid transport system substrate-binding protein